MLTKDTREDIDDDEPFIDVCYISDMLVNMITCDSQQFGIRLSDSNDSVPWSFEVFALGLDILLPRMKVESFKVLILMIFF
jgi:hypothetical protein